MQKFETLRQPLLWFWIAVVTRRRKQEKKKIPKIVATFVYASSQGSARTPLGPKIVNIETTLGVALSLAILTSIMLQKSSPHTLLRPFIKKTNLNDCNLYFNVAVTRNKQEFKMSSCFYNHDIARTLYSCKSVTSWINRPSSTLNTRNNYTNQINRQQIIWWWRSTWRRHFLWWDQE